MMNRIDTEYWLKTLLGLPIALIAIAVIPVMFLIAYIYFACVLAWLKARGVTARIIDFNFKTHTSKENINDR